MREYQAEMGFTEGLPQFARCAIGVLILEHGF
jgi:hypothetical protein